MKPVVSLLKSEGWTSVIYLDDFLIIGDSIESCNYNLRRTIQLGEFLGFRINFRKSLLIPSLRRKFMGLVLNVGRFIIILPANQRDNSIAELKKFLISKPCSIQVFSQLIGCLIAACPAVEYGLLLYTKSLEKVKLLALIDAKFN